MKHQLIGVVANNPVLPIIRPLSLPLLYHDFISLPYAEQMWFRRKDVPPHVCSGDCSGSCDDGCHIEMVSYPLDTGKSYFVNLLPLVENSILSQIVGPDLCPYDPFLAKGCKGEISYSSEYSRSEEAAEALRLIGKKGSVLYSDRIVSVEEGCPIPLLTMRNTSPLEDTK